MRFPVRYLSSIIHTTNQNAELEIGPDRSCKTRQNPPVDRCGSEFGPQCAQLFQIWEKSGVDLNCFSVRNLDSRGVTQTRCYRYPFPPSSRVLSAGHSTGCCGGTDTPALVLVCFRTTTSICSPLSVKTALGTIQSAHASISVIRTLLPVIGHVSLRWIYRSRNSFQSISVRFGGRGGLPLYSCSCPGFGDQSCSFHRRDAYCLRYCVALVFSFSVCPVVSLCVPADEHVSWDTVDPIFAAVGMKDHIILVDCFC